MKASANGSADVGMIGLAVMGRNLALNLADHGFTVAAYNRETAVMQRFIAEHPGTPGGLIGCVDLRSFVGALKRPRCIVMMIRAGSPVDAVCDALLPLLDPDDIVVDGGNSLWTDTRRRVDALGQRGIHFVGSGVSGGEVGARFGPSLMPGGSRQAWPRLRPMWLAIAAKVDAKTGRPLEGAAPGRPVTGGEPCTTWIGADGSGHFVKMVHNGIEYADMQLVSEAYFVLRRLLGLEPDALAEIFAEWNRGELDSFLIEITSQILAQRDPRNRRRWFIDVVLDAAGQKGTGKWTVTGALDVGVAAPTIAEAVFARVLSSDRESRVAASRRLRTAPHRFRGSRKELIESVREALYASKLCAYAQGFALMAGTARAEGWSLDLGKIAGIWRGGCIIRARFLQKITEAYTRDANLGNLLLDPFFRRKVQSAQKGWRRVVALAAEAGLPCPGMMSALAYYDGFREANLPASLLQAQRDYFGSHGYERVGSPRGQLFHFDPASGTETPIDSGDEPQRAAATKARRKKPR